MTTVRGPYDPPTDQSTGSVPLVAQAKLLGAYCWTERRLFEVLGTWVAKESDPAARLLFDAESRLHAWHSEFWTDRIPNVPGVADPDELTTSPGPELEELMATLGGDRGGGGTLVRLVGMSRVVSPRLVSGYLDHLRRCTDVADAPVIRALRLVISDETEAWQRAETMVQSLIRRPHDVAVVTAHQQRLEELVAGVGPGLVAWPDATSA